MTIDQLKQKFETRLGTHSGDPVVVVEAYFVASMRGEGFGAKLKVQPLNGKPLRTIEAKDFEESAQPQFADAASKAVDIRIAEQRGMEEAARIVESVGLPNWVFVAQSAKDGIRQDLATAIRCSLQASAG